ncbi:acyl-CoA dehydratase activase-related protein [Vagococcus carniphilus]|uniref:acyl-CoA dehydratase activase-related protein n=1 Tax=Vagococcus carniphilus TaxID=218144 RepID=UPI00288D4F57|nr:acyl-CoA dehydratase activase-related protein [Vagococcus carniphilus]MDT2815570.1 acyl-CoA dehydratase activase-related protein [Vagococcus carniphilus]
MILRVGIDVGSTTVKCVVLNHQNELIYSTYQRHFSDVKQATLDVLFEMKDRVGTDHSMQFMITGSGGMGLSDLLEIPFIQEVIAGTKAVEEIIPETDVAIELGGEDAKITFFEGSLEQRMNGSCAGGTGAFIDQMASLLKTDANGLNELAKNHHTIYPIASRCGVFAKTDIQPLINEGARKEDIAASVYQAVVNQTIAGLASGRKIKGNVALLGGPLFFMSELRNRFVETLELKEEQVIFPDNSQLFVALGAALSIKNEATITIDELIDSLKHSKKQSLGMADALPELFKDEEELQAFRKRHEKATLKEFNLADYHGPVFIGIDAGSTTTKVVVIGDESQLLYSFYGNNEGQPLETTINVLMKVYEMMPKDCYVAKSAVTGYGEHLIKHGLKVDIGEVETMAHYKAADYFAPGVDFILDIGGQDMKAMTVKDGALSSIQLNEACSSGCGSFIETFAKSLNYNVEDFAQAALESGTPVDLGSRCTVFMNSKVRQVQKEGATPGDISAGLAYSVIKNALYKVIKMKQSDDLGEIIVCQGGTFYNESVLRAFELISGREVIRPNIAGLMGAYGAALIALDEYSLDEKESELLSASEMKALESKKEFSHCGLCENNCLLTVTLFSDGRKFITGNRCERGAQQKITKAERRENLVEYKYRRLFKYRPLKEEEAKNGTIGIPRVLNMYENYPLWHTIFTDLGFKVVLSPKSDKELYEKGIETIPSDTVCYPAKLTHGHIEALIEEKVGIIFYPGVVFERIEDASADNHFNCPIVQSYSDVIKNNMDIIREGKVDYRNPYLNLADSDSVVSQLQDCFSDFNFSQEEIRKAVLHGYDELDSFKKDIQKRGEKVLEKMQKNNQKGIVLSGRPYHIDPEVNHGIANIITQEGFHVLTEDSICHLGDVKNLRVVNQWVYHSRLYGAAKVVAKMPNLELVQLNSFGCGLDAVTTDQVEEIMAQYGRIYTVLKIDEGSNLGAVRIRLRSLKAAIKEREKNHVVPMKKIEETEKVVFTKDMRKKHTLLLPMLSPIHQEGLVDVALKASGYNVVCLPSEDKKAIEIGLKYVNNDACYPAIISIGQLIEALQSGEYDVNNTSVMLTQTGGGCRATNYIPLLRKALVDAGFDQVPVVSISLGNQGVESNPGFKMSIPLMKKVAIAFLYGDLFEKVVYRTRPYEEVVGSVNELHDEWIEKVTHSVEIGSFRLFKKNMKQIVADFDRIPLKDIQKPKVGVVGEILVKYSPTANNDVVGILESEGAEAVVPGIIGFMNYSLYNNIWKYENLGFSKKSKWLAEFAIKLIEYCEKPMNQALIASERFSGITPIDKLADDASKILSIGNHTGEGWFLTGEMIDLLNNDVLNIICMQPFGCLPNHVVGKGVMKELRHQYPMANISAIDYDPGVSVVNQLNRIRLLLATAEKNMSETVQI